MTSPINFQQLYYDLLSLELDNLADILDPKRQNPVVNQVREYTAHNEFGLALEDLRAYVEKNSVSAKEVHAQIGILNKLRGSDD